MKTKFRSPLVSVAPPSPSGQRVSPVTSTIQAASSSQAATGNSKPPSMDSTRTYTMADFFLEISNPLHPVYGPHTQNPDLSTQASLKPSSAPLETTSPVAISDKFPNAPLPNLTTQSRSPSPSHQLSSLAVPSIDVKYNSFPHPLPLLLKADPSRPGVVKAFTLFGKDYFYSSTIHCKLVQLRIKIQEKISIVEERAAREGLSNKDIKKLAEYKDMLEGSNYVYLFTKPRMIRLPRTLVASSDGILMRSGELQQDPGQAQCAFGAENNFADNYSIDIGFENMSIKRKENLLLPNGEPYQLPQFDCDEQNVLLDLKVKHAIAAWVEARRKNRNRKKDSLGDCAISLDTQNNQKVQSEAVIVESDPVAIKSPPRPAETRSPVREEQTELSGSLISSAPTDRKSITFAELTSKLELAFLNISKRRDRSMDATNTKQSQENISENRKATHQTEVSHSHIEITEQDQKSIAANELLDQNFSNQEEASTRRQKNKQKIAASQSIAKVTRLDVDEPKGDIQELMEYLNSPEAEPEKEKSVSPHIWRSNSPLGRQQLQSVSINEQTWSKVHNPSEKEDPDSEQIQTMTKNPVVSQIAPQEWIRSPEAQVHQPNNTPPRAQSPIIPPKISQITDSEQYLASELLAKIANLESQVALLTSRVADLEQSLGARNATVQKKSAPAQSELISRDILDAAMNRIAKLSSPPMKIDLRGENEGTPRKIPITRFKEAPPSRPDSKSLIDRKRSFSIPTQLKTNQDQPPTPQATAASKVVQKSVAPRTVHIIQKLTGECEPVQRAASKQSERTQATKQLQPSSQRPSQIIAPKPTEAEPVIFLGKRSSKLPPPTDPVSKLAAESGLNIPTVHKVYSLSGSEETQILLPSRSGSTSKPRATVPSFDHSFKIVLPKHVNEVRPSVTLADVNQVLSRRGSGESTKALSNKALSNKEQRTAIRTQLASTASPPTNASRRLESGPGFPQAIQVPSNSQVRPVLTSHPLLTARSRATVSPGKLHRRSRGY